MHTPEEHPGRRWFSLGCGVVAGGLGLAAAGLSVAFGTETAVDMYQTHSVLPFAEAINHAELTAAGLGTLGGTIMMFAGVHIANKAFE